MSTCARHVIIAFGYVVEDACVADGVAVRRVTRRRSARAVLCVRQRVVGGIRIPLTAASVLIHQGLYPRHDRSSKRGSSASRETGGAFAIGGIGIAEHVRMSPRPAGREECHVGKVAHAVGWIALDRLPPWFRVSLASSAYHTRRGRSSRRAATGAAAAARDVQNFPGVANTLQAEG